MDAQVFISFASQDHKVAQTLCQALEARGFKCWISSRDILPGENFQVAIVKAIRSVRLMLLVFTASSNDSEEMNKELALASQRKLAVVPLRIDDVAPNDAFRYEFATRQWIDFFADWETAMNQLTAQIGNIVGAAPAPAPERTVWPQPTPTKRPPPLSDPRKAEARAKGPP
ncbi:MAG TPA: toll/interleukin-1 receptor domain-containing protein, partial [Caulobacteraceae bacterium]|nr:toll/interleukin-1 receptor domain-containing protein [Caulobacteraceae bacterium]